MTLHYLYVFGSEGGPFKVGYTNNPTRRISNLRSARRGVGEVYHTEKVGNDAERAIEAERAAHGILAEDRIDRSEWFSCDVETAIDALRRVAAEYGVNLIPEDPEQGSEFRINMTLDPDWLPLLDEWRKGQPDLPTRPEAVRRMVAAAIGVKSRNKRGRR